MLLPLLAGAQERGSIRGVVQRAGKGIATHRIMLIRFGPNSDVQRTPGQTDAEGHFVFDDLDPGKGFTYYVGIRYEGQFYRSEPIALQDAPTRSGVVLEINEPAAQVAGADAERSIPHILERLVVVILRGDYLDVREVVQVVNAGTVPYIGAAQDGMPHISLYLPLPAGYNNIRDVQGLEVQHVRSHAAGLYYTAPLAPGEHRVIYTYSLPMRDTVTMVLLEHALATTVFNLLVQEAPFAASSDLPFSGEVTFEPHSFTHFRGTNITAHSRSWLQLARRTAMSPVVRWSAYGLIVGIALLGVMIPCYEIWFRRQGVRRNRSLPLPAQMEEGKLEEQYLLQKIVHLDEQREAGVLQEAAYQRQRQFYKQQLGDLVRQLHEMQEQHSTHV
jgi:hypothetical protein